MRNLIVDEVRSFRDLVRQQAPEASVRKESQELPPAPSGQQQPGAGMGPAYSEELTEEVEAEEEPSSALERQLGQHRIA